MDYKTRRVLYSVLVWFSTRLSLLINKNITFIFLINIIFLSTVGCGLFNDIQGIWIIKQEECSYRERSGIFINNIKPVNQYKIEFKNDKTVKLIYSNVNISVTKKQQDEVTVVEKNNEVTVAEKNTCDVNVLGRYSYNISGKIRFDFTNEQGQYDIIKGSNCAIETPLAFTKLPDNSPYIEKPLVSVNQIGSNTLVLGFSGSPKCKSNTIFTYFDRE